VHIRLVRENTVGRQTVTQLGYNDMRTENINEHLDNIDTTT